MSIPLAHRSCATSRRLLAHFPYPLHYPRHVTSTVLALNQIILKPLASAQLAQASCCTSSFTRAWLSLSVTSTTLASTFAPGHAMSLPRLGGGEL